MKKNYHNHIEDRINNYLKSFEGNKKTPKFTDVKTDRDEYHIEFGETFGFVIFKIDGKLVTKPLVKENDKWRIYAGNVKVYAYEFSEFLSLTSRVNTYLNKLKVKTKTEEPEPEPEVEEPTQEEETNVHTD